MHPSPGRKKSSSSRYGRSPAWKLIGTRFSGKSAPAPADGCANRLCHWWLNRSYTNWRLNQWSCCTNHWLNWCHLCTSWWQPWPNQLQCCPTEVRPLPWCNQLSAAPAATFPLSFLFSSWSIGTLQFSEEPTCFSVVGRDKFLWYQNSDGWR